MEDCEPNIEKNIKIEIEELEEKPLDVTAPQQEDKENKENKLTNIVLEWSTKKPLNNNKPNFPATRGKTANKFPSASCKSKTTSAPGSTTSTNAGAIKKTTVAKTVCKLMPPPAAVSTKPKSPHAPHAYEVKDLYQKRKEEALRKREEEERKMREFRSRPAPNLSKAEPKKTKVHLLVCPVTPQVLKNSQEAREKRMKKVGASFMMKFLVNF